jgi:hypothetical protein
MFDAKKFPAIRTAVLVLNLIHAPIVAADSHFAFSLAGGTDGRFKMEMNGSIHLQTQPPLGNATTKSEPPGGRL